MHSWIIHQVCLIPTTHVLILLISFWHPRFGDNIHCWCSARCAVTHVERKKEKLAPQEACLWKEIGNNWSVRISERKQILIAMRKSKGWNSRNSVHFTRPVSRAVTAWAAASHCWVCVRAYQPREILYSHLRVFANIIGAPDDQYQCSQLDACLHQRSKRTMPRNAITWRTRWWASLSARGKTLRGFWQLCRTPYVKPYTSKVVQRCMTTAQRWVE